VIEPKQTAVFCRRGFDISLGNGKVNARILPRLDRIENK